MVHADRRLAAVRDAGEAVIEVLDIGFRPARDTDARGEQELREDPRYGPCLEAVRSAVDEFDSVEMNHYRDGSSTRALSLGPIGIVLPDASDDGPSTSVLTAERRFKDESLCTLSVLYRSDGRGQVIVTVETANGTIYPIEGEDFELSPLQVGRYVAQAELAILVAELGSCAEALDYSIVEEQPLTYNRKEGNYEFKSDSTSPLASDWHTTRGVTKQAVNKNAKSASNKLHERTEDSDTWI